MSKQNDLLAAMVDRINKSPKAYEETVEVGGDTLWWDGDTSGHYVVTEAGLVHISDAVPTSDDLENGFTLTVTLDEGTDTYAFSASDIVVDSGALQYTHNNYTVIVIPSDGFEFSGVVFEKKGCYILHIAELYHTYSITIPGYTGFITEETVVKTIDTKFLPEALQFGETGGDTVWSDGDLTTNIPDTIFFKVSDATPTMDDFANGFTYHEGTPDSHGSVYFAADSDALAEDTGINLIVAFNFYIFSADTVLDADSGLIIPKGTYAVGESPIGITIPGYTGFQSVKKIDGKYLPDALQFGEEEVISSDTITWDGNTDGLVSDSTGVFWKISDATPSDDEMNAGNVKTTTADGVEYDKAISDISGDLIIGDGYWYNAGILLVVARTAGVAIGNATLPETGIYVYGYANVELTIPGCILESTTKVATIKSKYLPPETPVIPSATVGQYVRVKAVDDNGVPTDWEAAELSPLILDYDDSHYMYEFGKDTTDSSQRMTKAELAAAFYGGRAVYGIFDGFYTNVDVSMLNELGLSYGMVSLKVDSSYDTTILLYTAEYTAET